MNPYSFEFMKKTRIVDAHGNEVNPEPTNKRGLNPNMPFNADMLEKSANKDNNKRG